MNSAELFPLGTHCRITPDNDGFDHVLCLVIGNNGADQVKLRYLKDGPVSPSDRAHVRAITGKEDNWHVGQLVPLSPLEELARAAEAE